MEDSDFWKEARVNKLIGSGTYAKVYSILDSNNQNFAIKIIKTKKSNSSIPEIPQSLLYELNAYAFSRDISETIDLIDVHYRKRHIGLLFEEFPMDLVTYIEGTTFNERNRRIFDLLQVCFRFLAQFEYHDHCHFDIKPQNILVRGSEFKFIDLGLSLSNHGFVNDPYRELQTLNYRAPEIMVKRKRSEFLPVQSEIWSVGLIILEMSVGRSIFNISYPDEAYSIYETLFEKISILGTNLDICNFACSDNDRFGNRSKSLKWKSLLFDGIISGQCRVKEILNQELESGEYEKLNPRVILSCEQMLQLNPWDRISIEEWLKLYDPEFYSSHSVLKSPLLFDEYSYSHQYPYNPIDKRIPVKNLSRMIKIGVQIELNPLSLGLSCDLLSRYYFKVSKVRKIKFLDEIVCLMVSSQMINPNQITIQKIWNSCSILNIKTNKIYTPQDLSLTEHRILKEVDYLIYSCQTRKLFNKIKRKFVDFKKITNFDWLT